MAIQNFPVWPFEPNWSSSVSEVLEWLTDIMVSPVGAEQRRSLRWFPRRFFEYELMTHGEQRSLLDNLLASYSARTWYVPIWWDCNVVTVGAATGDTILVCPSADDSRITEGSIVFISNGDPYVFEMVEIAAVNSAGVTLQSPLVGNWPAGTRIYPVTTARLTDQPTLRKRSDAVVSGGVRFRALDVEVDPGAPTVEAGPLIADGLIVNSYHQETGRGGYFHHNSGTSEGQFIFIYGLYLAYEQLRSGTASERTAATYYRLLAEEMLDAMGTGTDYTGPMLRQPIPASVNEITLLHWLFAARGDVPGQRVVFAYETEPQGGKLIIPSNANGANVYTVWAIYPGSSNLLYPSPYSPAFDSTSPGAPTQIEIEPTDWEQVSNRTEITIPAGSPSHATWKVIYGYRTGNIIPIKHGYEAYPNWTPIEPGYAACAPDTFRWFEQAMTKAIEHDVRPGKATRWTRLRGAMRRSAVKGQAISDLREVIQPMPGFEAIPVKGEPTGVYCYSDHPAAVAPTVPGANPAWLGYTFWSRAPNGDVIADVPPTSELSQVQYGRGFSDQWREGTTYQDPDQYLYVAVSATKKPNASLNEHFLVYVSSTMTYDEDTRWYADIGALSEFTVLTGDVHEFFIPRSSFRKRTFGVDGESVWGSTLPAGTHIENFGISSEMRGDYIIRLRKMRMVAGPSAAWVDANKAEAVAGAKLPFFPGALPFAINADLRKQMFVGWNGSPFHGYQLPDHWWWLGADAEYVHPDLTAADLPIPDPVDGSITYPISPVVTGSSPAIFKPKNALLMEQQLLFLKQAQDQYEADGGDEGPFAHTFVLNTPARATLGNPTPHTWIYINDDPNTRWVGYQTRVVESLAELVDLTTGQPSFEDARNMATDMAIKWLQHLNTVWPDLDGKLVSGTRIYGMPTDYPDPNVSDPQTFYEEPHAVAHILRACVILRKSAIGYPILLDNLMVRCWGYLEMMWRTSGPMRFTWSPDPAARTWYGFWHGDIMTTLSVLLSNEVILPSGINPTTVRQRLVQTQQWLQNTGVGTVKADPGSGLVDVYRSFYVLPGEPDDRESTDFQTERMLEELDNQLSVPLYRDKAGRPFLRQDFAWMLRGRADHARFTAMLTAMRGRSRPLWVPTFMQDFVLAEDVDAGATNITVERSGFTLSGGPRFEREDIVIETTAGRVFNRIVDSALVGDDQEVLALEQPIEASILMKDVVRVCFMSLMRLDSDTVEIQHMTDDNGISTVKLRFRSAPDNRVPDPAFYE